MRLYFNKLLAIVFCVTILCIKDTLAQDTSNTVGRVSIASPTAAALGKYGDIPVSYYTGIPNIGIPIYTVKSGSLELPISLSYHAGGLKVQEQASWVGAGWSLNAGGMVTRSVIGAPDDRGNSNIGNNNVTSGYYSDRGFQSYANPTAINDDQNFVRGFKDGEPDLYFFNFGGYSGKFYFNDDQTPVLLPGSDFNIQPFYQLGPGFVGFVITTTDGVKYYFGQTGNHGSVAPIEYTIPFNILGGASNPATSSWFLNKVVSADEVDSILLNYQQEQYGTYTLAFSPMTNVDYQPNDPTKNGINLVKNIITGVRLSSITTPNATISFTPSANPRLDLSSGASLQMADAANTSAYSLGSISINSGSFCKKYSLYYSYFQDATPLNSNYFSGYNLYNIQSDQYRLRLDSMHEVSCDNSIQKPAYVFNYFSETVPRKLSFGIDHWGYSNGVTTNTGSAGLVPTYNIIDNTGNTTVYNGANRDAAWLAMRCGSLQQITYPTGGYTSLDYEAKDATSYTSSTTSMTNVSIANVTVRMYGQSAYTNTTYFASNGNQITVNVTNASNYSAYLSVMDVNNSVVYSTNISNSNGSYPFTGSIPINLSAGNYSVTLSLPNYYNVTGGASMNMMQWQTTTTTNTQNLLVGGLRIKTITNNDGITSNNVVTSYNYNGGGNSSSGFLYTRPTYVQILRNDIYALVWPYASQAGCSTADGFNAHGYYITPGSVQPLQNAQGENVGFGEVDVTQTGNGKLVYRYYGNTPWSTTNKDVCIRSITQSSICDNTIPNYPPAPLPYDFMRGELKYDAAFNQNGQLIKENYHFPVYVNDPLPTPGHITVGLSGFYTFTEYNLQSAKKISDSSYSSSYDPTSGNYLTSTQATYYTSPYHHMPTIKNSFTSNNVLVSSTVKYAFDFRVPNCDAIPDSLSVYLNAIHNDSIWLNNNIYGCSPQVGNSNNCRSAIFTQFRQKMQKDRVNFIGFRTRNYAPNNNAPLACYQLNENIAADNLLKPILHLQDEYINAPIETVQWKNGQLLEAHYTNYGYVNNPTGYVYPIADQVVKLNTPSTSFVAANVGSGSIVWDSRYTKENTINYNAGRIADATSKSGVTTAYIWGYNNQYPVAKIGGTSYNAAIGLVNQATIGNRATSDVDMQTELNKLRTGLNNAMVSTYTYAPEMGITTETDPRAYSLSYNYDALGRLVRVKDKDANILKQTNYVFAAPANAAPPASGFNMIVNNRNGTYTGYTVQLTAISGGNSQTFIINSLGNNTIGPVVSGIYNIIITPPPDDPNGLYVQIFGSGTYISSSGSTASFNNVTLGPSDYNTIRIY